MAVQLTQVMTWIQLDLTAMVSPLKSWREEKLAKICGVTLYQRGFTCKFGVVYHEMRLGNPKDNKISSMLMTSHHWN